MITLGVLTLIVVTIFMLIPREKIEHSDRKDKEVKLANRYYDTINLTKDFVSAQIIEGELDKTTPTREKKDAYVSDSNYLFGISPEIAEARPIGGGLFNIEFTIKLNTTKPILTTKTDLSGVSFKIVTENSSKYVSARVYDKIPFTDYREVKKYSIAKGEYYDFMRNVTIYDCTETQENVSEVIPDARKGKNTTVYHLMTYPCGNKTYYNVTEYVTLEEFTNYKYEDLKQIDLSSGQDEFYLSVITNSKDDVFDIEFCKSIDCLLLPAPAFNASIIDYATASQSSGGGYDPITLTLSSAPSDGDILIYIHGANRAVDTPSGWTEIMAFPWISTNFQVLGKVASGEGTSFNFTPSVTYMSAEGVLLVIAGGSYNLSDYNASQQSDATSDGELSAPDRINDVGDLGIVAELAIGAGAPSGFTATAGVNVYYGLDVAHKGNLTGTNIGVNNFTGIATWQGAKYVMTLIVPSNVTGGGGGGYSSSCTYTSGNWVVNMSDHCITNSTINVSSNAIILYGNGTLNFNSTIYALNITNLTNNKRINMSSNATVRLG